MAPIPREALQCEGEIALNPPFANREIGVEGRDSNCEMGVQRREPTIERSCWTRMSIDTSRGVLVSSVRPNERVLRASVPPLVQRKPGGPSLPDRREQSDSVV